MVHLFKGIYPYVPVWAQNLGISLYGYSYRHERLGGRFSQHVKGFEERERWSEPVLARYVNQELRRILLRAFDHVLYYRETWEAANISRSDLERLTVGDLLLLPRLAKDDVRQRPEAFLARDIPTRKLRRYYTSGTTGTPITSFCTSADHQRFFAAREARSFNWANVSIREARAMIGGRLITPRADSGPPYYRYNFAERQVYFTAYHIGPRTAWNYVDGLNRYQPVVLTGYAYSYFLLASLILEQNLKLTYRPKAIIVGSEPVTSGVRSVIERAFKARVYEEYGAVEQSLLATECERGSLHINSDFGIIEIVDENDRPVPPGVEGRILTTGLLNDTQPLIRYDIGDVASLSPTPCTCGRSLPVLKNLVGRLEDVVICPDGRQMVRFHGIFVGMPNVVEAQLIQERIDLIRVKVVANERFGPSDEELIKTRVATERLGNVQVIVERVAKLDRTHAGKFRAVVSKVNPQELSVLRAELRNSDLNSDPQNGRSW
jgi:phenylacetate-CoA ligase